MIGECVSSVTFGIFTSSSKCMNNDAFFPYPPGGIMDMFTTALMQC